MKDIWKRHFKAVLWKEFIESIRTSKISLPLTIVFVVVMQYLPMAQIINNDALTIKQKDILLSSLAIYIPLMVIPFFGNTLVYRSLHEEKRNRTIQILMASGILRTAVWFAKFLMAALLSYFVSLVSLLGFAAFLNFYVGRPLVFNGATWVLILFNMPFSSFGILAIVSVVYWWVKNAQIIGMVVPIVSLVGVWNISLKFGNSYSAPVALLYSFIIGIALIGISFYGITHITKDRIVSQ